MAYKFYLILETVGHKNYLKLLGIISMKMILHTYGKDKIAEVNSDQIIINNVQDALDLLTDIYYKDSNKLILHEENICPDFFNLSTGLAGEILQKCVNYKIKLAVVGDFSKYMSKSLNAFIIESNRGKQFFFLEDVGEAIKIISNV